MAMIQGAPTEGANRLAALSFGGAQNMAGLALSAQQQRLNIQDVKRQRILQQLARLREERKQRKAEAKSKRIGQGGSTGAAIGAAAAVVAAPFTGGASLVLLPAAAAIGGGIGTAAAGGDGTQQIVQGATQLGSSMVPNIWSGGGTGPLNNPVTANRFFAGDPGFTPGAGQALPPTNSFAQGPAPDPMSPMSLYPRWN